MKLEVIESDYGKSLDKFLEFIFGKCDDIQELEFAYDYVQNNFIDVLGDVNDILLFEFFDNENMHVKLDDTFESRRQQFDDAFVKCFETMEEK